MSGLTEATRALKRWNEGKGKGISVEEARRTSPASRPVRKVDCPLEGQLDLDGNEATVETDKAHAWRDRLPEPSE
jgi:hypothetical protein